jgi:hypothetical protein
MQSIPIPAWELEEKSTKFSQEEKVQVQVQEKVIIYVHCTK